MVVLSKLSEGPSSSSSTQAHKYDVFLSFRGVDTRHNFTDHLYNALSLSNISTFLDDEEIETGEDLKPELRSAIKASRASVIVLSKTYATSTWCLDELVLILEQRMKSNHVVIPIFYHVKPTHVRKQKSSFGDAMAKHRKMMEAEINVNKRSQWVQKMDQWNQALREVADLKGMDANGRHVFRLWLVVLTKSDYRLEVEFIDEIVKDIFHRLHISSRFPLPQLFGMDKSIKFITSWLKEPPSHKIDIITIFGIGGIGKTSLAKYVYRLHSHEFDTSCFVENINRRCEKIDGLLDFQKQLYDEIAKRSSIQVHDVSIYTSMIENAVSRKKVFLVLDDIGSLDQLDGLLGNKGFHLGTKIMITTKDAWLTERCALFKMSVEPKYAKYMLNGLSESESQKLLCFHAFMCNNPKAGYEEVSGMLVKYCQGHPMALKVLGRSLYNRDATYWEGYIDRLKKENDSPINNVLRMSFNSLPSENDKELFKHIACIFVGMDRNDVVTILEACDIETKTGITNLIDKCLLSIGLYNELIMHELVQEMGRFLVREESLYKPWERSRLWGHESFTMLKDEKGTENVLGLTLDIGMLEEKNLHGSLELKTDALSKMDRLMLLQLDYVQITGSYKNFPKKLVWLSMQGFPLKSVPSDLPMENLVALDMSNSYIESFGVCYSYPQRLHNWLKQFIGSGSKDKKLLGSLKILNLSFCERLCSLDGFDHIPKLETLILKGCIGLLEISESIEQCDELVFVDLSYCNKLRKLPKLIGMLKTIKTLSLDGCSLGESQVDIMDMDSTEKIKTNNIGISTIISSSSFLQAMPSYLKFSEISLQGYLVSLLLENNNLSTESFPLDFSCLTMLKELYLNKNPIVSLPSCVRSLPRLEKLCMVNCNMLTSVEHPPHTLTFLDLYSSYSNKPLLRKVVFNPQMSPLKLFLGWKMHTRSSLEFEGLVKIEPMAGVEEKVFCSLGWTKLDFLNGIQLTTSVEYRESEESEIQMYYEFGIFSTIYGGEEMPNWITYKSARRSISFTVPSSLTRLRGLNFCCVLTSSYLGEEDGFLYLPVIIISNITKNLTWIYQHCIECVLDVGGKCLILLSHWMFGVNEMECGDHVSINVRWAPHDIPDAVNKECGVSFVYDDEKTDEEEENVLGYYKSWNHILGGDLTGFQLTSGEYLLSKDRIMSPFIDIDIPKYDHLCENGARFKEQFLFRALSGRKSALLEDGP
ncbi:hypothetical protein Lser_V15G03791 [Lactuca serriola]